MDENVWDRGEEVFQFQTFESENLLIKVETVKDKDRSNMKVL